MKKSDLLYFIEFLYGVKKFYYEQIKIKYEGFYHISKAILFI